MRDDGPPLPPPERWLLYLTLAIALLVLVSIALILITA